MIPPFSRKTLAVGLAAVLAISLGVSSPVRTDASPARCDVPGDVRGFRHDIPHARAAIADGRLLTVVALGSSSTQGAGASSEETTYPAVLKSELARLLPGHHIRVVNSGIGGNSAHQMYLRIESDVLAEHPALVIWQTGVNDAIHDVGIERFKRLLRKGIAKLREAGADVVLMDHQPVPRMERYPRYLDYLTALREVAADTGTPVYRRFDVMGELIRSGRLRSDEIFSSDALHMVDGSYFCVGATLARTLAEKLSPRAVAAAR